MSTVGTITVVVEGKDYSLSSVLDNVAQKMRASGQAATDYSGTMARIPAAQLKAESATLAYAQSLARVQFAAGNSSQAIFTLGSALNRVTPNTLAANNALAKLQSMMANANKASVNQSNGFNTYSSSADKATKKTKSLDERIVALGEGMALLGTVGAVATSVTELVSLGNTLEKTEATVKALAGSQEFYNEIVDLATERQRKFGGTFEENLKGFGQFANLSKRTGIEIEALTNQASRLAAIDPAQGLEGAALALKEFFSGDTQSLVERFELDRTLLNSIKDIEDPIQKVAELDKVLNTLGATQELLDAQANTTAATYDKLTGSFVDMGAQVGTLMASAFEPFATGLSNIFTLASNGIDQLNKIGSTVQGFSDSILASAGSYDAYLTKVQEVNSQLSPLTGYITELTAAQYAYAQSLLASGTSLEEVNRLLQENGGNIAAIENITTQMRDGFSATDSELQAFVTNLNYLSTTSQQAGDYATDLAFNVATGAASFEDAAFAVQVQVDALHAHAEAQANAKAEADALAQAEADKASAIDAANTAIAEQIQKSIDAKLEGEKLNDMQKEIEQVAYQVAQGLGSSAAGAEFLASKYNIATDAAYNLLNAQLALLNTERAASVGTSFGDNSKDEFRAPTARRTTKEIQQLEEPKPRTTPTKDPKPPKKPKAKGGSGGKGKGATSEAEKEAEKLKNIEEKLQEDLMKLNSESRKKLLENEKKYKESQLKIYADYNKKIAEQEKKNEVSKRYSRADFYDSLAGDTEAGIDSSKYAAEYEQAFAESQELAQKGQKKLSEEFLKLRTDHINAMKELDKEEAAVRNNDSLTDAEKQRRLEFIAGRRQLREEAQREELNALLEGGDEINNALEDQLASEAQAYEDSKNEIITAAKEQADERIRESDRATQKILENAQKEKDALAGIVPPKPTVDTLDSTNPVLPPSTSPSSTVQQPMLVPNGILLVEDSTLNTSLKEFATMSEAKLQAIIEGISQNNAILTSKLSSIESAIKSSRSNNNTSLIQG